MRGKKRFVKLTTEQRLALEQGFKKSKRAVFRQRCHFLLLSDQGIDIQSIAQIYDVARQSVAVWLDRFEQQGIEGLHTRKGQGMKPLLRLENKVEVEAVENLVNEHAQNLRPVLLELEKRFNKPMSKRTLQRFLKRLGIVGNASDAS